MARHIIPQNPSFWLGHTALDLGVGSFEFPLPAGRGSLESERGVVVVDRGVPWRVKGSVCENVVVVDQVDELWTQSW